MLLESACSQIMPAVVENDILAKNNPFAETDRLLLKADLTGWDTGSRETIARWTVEEEALEERANHVAAMLESGAMTEERLVAADPTAKIRTSYEATDYTTITAPPTPLPSKTARFFGRRPVSSDEILARDSWGNFDLRDEINNIHARTEDRYWDEVTELATKRVAALPGLVLEPSDALLTAAVETARAELGPFTPISETQKLGYTSALDIEIPPTDKLGPRIYTTISRGLEKLGKIKPIARLKVAAGQATANFGNALTNYDQLPLGKRLAVLGVGTAAMVGIVSLGYAGSSDIMPEQSELSKIAAGLVGLDRHRY